MKLCELIGFFLQSRGEAVGHFEGEFVVEQAEGLEGGEGFIALGRALAGVGAVERGHKRVGLGADDEAIHGTPMALGPTSGGRWDGFGELGA